MIALRVLAVLAGALVVAWVLWSAIRTVVVPRGESVWLSRKVFLVVREVFELAGRRTRTYEAYDRVMARYAPTSLVVLPGVWALIVLISFVPIYWGVGVGSWRLAVTTSGSSFSTLGFDRPPGLPAEMVCFVEALIGLFLVALLISYLPAHLQRVRPARVARWSSSRSGPAARPAPRPSCCGCTASAGSTTWPTTGTSGSSGSSRWRRATPPNPRCRSSGHPAPTAPGSPRPAR